MGEVWAHINGGRAGTCIPSINTVRLVHHLARLSLCHSKQHATHLLRHALEERVQQDEQKAREDDPQHQEEDDVKEHDSWHGRNT